MVYTCVISLVSPGTIQHENLGSHRYNNKIRVCRFESSIFNYHNIYFHYHTELVPFSVRSITHPPRTKKNPAKIGARNSGIAPTATCFGVRLRRPPSQPDADSQVETRKTRITRADFRRAFPIRTKGGGSVLGGIPYGVFKSFG